MVDLSDLRAQQLLSLHARVMEELRVRGLVRSANNPTGDLAEHLFCCAFGWEQTPKSEAQADAISKSGKRYQIKGRRITPHSGSRQLSALRGLPDQGFDVLAGVLLNEDYTVMRAALIPYELVLERSTYIPHTNSWKFLLRDEVWDWPGVEDVTDKLRRVNL